jgi:flavin-dependent dehydrogenase
MSARFVSPVRVLGPLAVDARGVGAPGLLLAGDAAGFVDPMTGDGLHLAITSAGQAADAALGILESGDFAAGLLRLAQERRATLGRKQRFNRVLRRFVDSPVALELAGWGARVLPGAVRRAVCYAGDAA